MNKFLMALCAVVMSSSAMAKGMGFFHGSFEQALSKAGAENKLVFIDVYTDWCGPCKQMASTVFPNEHVGEFYNANFVNFKLDAEKGEGPELAEKYEVNSFPTLLFVGANGDVVKRAATSMNSGQFLEFGKAVAADKKVDFDTLKARYDNGERNAELLGSLLLEAPLYSEKFPYDSKEAEAFWTENAVMTEEFFAMVPHQSLINSRGFGLIALSYDGPLRGVPVVEFVFDHYDEFVEQVGAADVTGFVLRIHNQTINGLAIKGDKGYRDYVEQIRTHSALIAARSNFLKMSDPSAFEKLDYYTLMKLGSDMSYAVATKQWKKSSELNQQYMDFAGENVDWSTPLGFAGALLDGGCNDRSVYQKIEASVQQAHQDVPAIPDYKVIYPGLLAKLGKTEQAKAILKDLLARAEDEEARTTVRNTLNKL